jgi:long-chain acyl-CoA synthetase
VNDRTVLDLYRHDLQAPRERHYSHWYAERCRFLSTSDFLCSTAALADSFDDLGVSKGDRVMLLADNRPEWHMVDLAVLDLGAVDVPVYQTLTFDQIAYQLEHSGARVAVVETAEQADRLSGMRARCPNLRHIVQIEEPIGDGVLAFDELTAGSSTDPEGRFWERAARLDERDLATIIYTSGTTGEPKGVMLSHRNLVQDATFTNRRLDGCPDDVALEFLPLCHTAERTAGYCYMQHGMSRAYCSVEHVGQVISAVRPTIFFAVPRVHEKVYQKVMGAVEQGGALRRWLFSWAMSVGEKAADLKTAGREIPAWLDLNHSVADRLVLHKIRDALGGRVRFCISGGAAIPGYIADFFHAVGVPLVDAYGLTETSPVIVLGGRRPEDVRRGWVGRALDNLDVTLADDGEILVKGPVVMMGYWRNPEATADVMTGDGYFKTGDVGEMDADGFVRIIDRKKELIVTAGGKNVAPQPVEAELKRSPLVDTAVVIGEGRRFVAALISPDFDQLESWAKANGVEPSSRDELLAHPAVQGLYNEIVDAVNRPLARYERIREHRLIAATLSVAGGHLTPTMKIKRRVIDREFAATIAEIYTS